MSLDCTLIVSLFMIMSGLLSRIFGKSEKPIEPQESETISTLLRAKAEVDARMFYSASYESQRHDPYLLRFLGRDGVRRAFCDKPPWLD